MIDDIENNEHAYDKAVAFIEYVNALNTRAAPVNDVIANIIVACASRLTRDDINDVINNVNDNDGPDVAHALNIVLHASRVEHEMSRIDA